MRLSELCHWAASYPEGQSNSPNTNVLQPLMRHGLFWEARVAIMFLSPMLPDTHTHAHILTCTHRPISCGLYPFYNTYIKIMPGGILGMGEVVVASVSSGLTAQVVEGVN